MASTLWSCVSSYSEKMKSEGKDYGISYVRGLRMMCSAFPAQKGSRFD